MAHLDRDYDAPAETAYSDADGRAFGVREAGPRDAAAYIDYMRAMLPGNTYYRLEEDDVVWAVEKERTALADYARVPHKAFFLAVRNGGIIGHIEIRGDGRRRIRHVAELGMGVIPRERGRGVGRALMEHAERWARDGGVIRMLTLWVFATNTPARRLYEQMGYRETGRKPGAVILPDGPDDEVLMVKNIRQG